MHPGTTSSVGPARTGRSGGRGPVLALGAEHQAGGAALIGDVDGGILEWRRELLGDEDLHALLLGDLVAGGGLIGESEADGDLARLVRLREDAQAVVLGDILALAKLGEQVGSAAGDLEHNLSLGMGVRPIRRKTDTTQQRRNLRSRLVRTARTGLRSLAMSTSHPTFRWRSIALPALLPTLLFSIGEGAIIPIIPVAAGNLGATLAIAGLVAGLLTIGELFGNIPSGSLIARFGERPAMIAASALATLGLLVCLVATHPALLGLGILLVGLSAAVFALARHAFMTSFVPFAYRARALSTLGGTHRAGFFIGPMLSALLIEMTGDVTSAFWLHVVACLGAALVLLTMPDPEATFGATRAARHDHRDVPGGGDLPAAGKPPGLFRTIYRSRELLARIGLGAALVGALRASRAVILPLWALSIGVGASDTALIIGVAGAVDFALFYAGGAVMDRFGRLWTAVPAMVGLGCGHLLLAATHDLPGSVAWFVGAALILSIANGFSSGILMTLGADLADRRNPAPFLGAWRFTTGIGAASSPLLIAGVTAVASLPAAAAVLGLAGLVGAGVLGRYVPRFIPRASPISPPAGPAGHLHDERRPRSPEEQA
jgi:MFS family permease